MTMKSKAKKSKTSTAKIVGTGGTTKAKARAPAPAVVAATTPSKAAKQSPNQIQEKDHRLPDEFDLNQASKALSTLLAQIQKSRQNTLFEDAPVRINMDVVAFKVPEGLGHFVNINLPHSPYPPQPDILFVIPDDRRNETEPEQLVNRMKDKLREKGVEGIREVMTVKQVKNDFSTFEAKRELAKRIDIVIGMKSICTLLPSILGREFYKKKKFPLELELHDEDDWEQEFEKVMKKTVFNISLNGPTSTLLVGQSSLNVAELTDNVSKIVNWLMRMYPGRWKNVSQLALTTNGVPPLMIYLGTGNRKDVGKALTKGRKVTEPVVGDLSTLPGRRVKIHPYGQINLIKGSDSESDLEVDAASDSGEEEKEEDVTPKLERKPATVEDDDESPGSDADTGAGRKNKKKPPKSESDLNSAERKYVNAVFKRQEFEDSQEEAKALAKKQKRKSEEGKGKQGKPKKRTKSKA